MLCKPVIGFCYRFQAESLLVGFLPLLGACLWLAAPATAQTTYSPWLNPTITLPHLTLTSAPTAPPHHPHQCRLGVNSPPQPDLLGGLRQRVQRADRGERVFHLLRVGPLADTEAADHAPLIALLAVIAMAHFGYIPKPIALQSGRIV